MIGPGAGKLTWNVMIAHDCNQRSPSELLSLRIIPIFLPRSSHANILPLVDLFVTVLAITSRKPPRIQHGNHEQASII